MVYMSREKSGSITEINFLSALLWSVIGLSLCCVSEVSVQKKWCCFLSFLLTGFCCFQAALSDGQSEEFAAVSKSQPKENDWKYPIFAVGLLETQHRDSPAADHGSAGRN